MSEYSPRACIPTAPILERAEQWIEQHHYRISNDGVPEGGALTFELMCGINHRVLGKQKMMTFDLADRILCKTGFEQDWYFHPVLAPVYAKLRLRPNEQDLRILGDEKSLKALARRRKYTKTSNAKRAQARAFKRQHPRALDKQRSERYDILEAEQAAA